ncbi:acyl-CoA dehydrogenase [Brackiella oedipodis]|uniref:acyl-CoA dehydrogenase n=1 Tax=Brackiella oedipodis TaxID=124225 RepID=UPI00049012C9|nr:acyl-CoA dehydrogenase [Brackiella oedipodis]
MTYKSPVDDYRFNIHHMGLLEKLNKIPQYAEISQDIVDSVLDENVRIVENTIAPLNREGDLKGAQWQDGVVKSSPGFKEAYKTYVEGGWQGLAHDEKYGGQNFPQTINNATLENLNSANLSLSLCPLLTNGALFAIHEAGSQALKDTYIRKMVEGTWTGTMNLTEPQAGSDLALLKTKAIKQEDGTYRITGQKIFITWGEHDMTENIVHLVLARTPDAPEGVKGISLFVVPKFLVNEDGSLGKRNDVYCASLEHKLGIHASPTAVMMYGDNKGEVGAGAIGYLVGEENAGLKYMFIMMNEARFSVGVQGIGISERAMQQAFAYAQERLQGNTIDGSEGRKTVAINRHPDVQRMLLTMKSQVQGARSLAFYCAYCHDMARAAEDEETRKHYQSLSEYLVPIVKGFSTEMSMELTNLAIQVHGGMGFIEETGVAQHMRDARILSIYEGTTAIQANDLLGRKTYKDMGAACQAIGGQVQKTLQALEAEGSDTFKFIAARLQKSLKNYADTVMYLMQQGQARHLNEAFMGSVPYLMLSGYLFVGWKLAQSALVANKLDNKAYHEKIALAQFYAAHILPRTAALGQSVLAGEQAVQSATEVDFSV